MNTQAETVLDLLKAFRWNLLERAYGNPHNTTVGFLSTEWLNKRSTNSVFDGAPSPSVGEGRKGQHNADLILCQGEGPLIVVEVETVATNYRNKLAVLYEYFDMPDVYPGLEYGLLVMLNSRGARSGLLYRTDHEQFEELKNLARRRPDGLALVSVEKRNERQQLGLRDTPLSRLRLRNSSGYHCWRIDHVEAWAKDAKGREASRDLWQGSP